MKRNILKEALGHISDRHIAEAAQRKTPRLRWLGAIAALLALVILATTVLDPLTLRAKAVSLAEYPDYSRQYRGPEVEAVLPQLEAFFTDSMAQTLSGSTENQTYSPVNLYMALCLMAETADGNDQILSLLNTESREALRQQANLIWNACYYDDHNHTLLANSLWLDKGLRYDTGVMDILAKNYYTSVYESDLQSTGTAKAIEKWLNKQTGNILKSSTGRPVADSQTVMLLYSTVYYQAKWSEGVRFRASNNTKSVFHSPTGNVTCTFMNKKEMQTYYYWAEDFGAISLSLKDGSRMWLLLPDMDKTTDQVLASEEFSRLLFRDGQYENSKYLKVNLSIPKFDIRDAGDLKEDLQLLGVTDVFDPATSGLSATVQEDMPLWFNGVNQATRVAIDEEGVTAASYIEIPGAGAAQPPEEIIDFILDRPFVFVITNRYELPLFAGVVNQP